MLRQYTAEILPSSMAGRVMEVWQVLAMVMIVIQTLVG